MGRKTKKRSRDNSWDAVPRDPYVMIQEVARRDLGYGVPFCESDLGRAVTCRPGFNGMFGNGMSLEDYTNELVKYGALGLLKNDGDHKVYVLLKPDKRGKRVCYEAAVVRQ
jgi:hypothetical protein